MISSGRLRRGTARSRATSFKRATPMSQPKPVAGHERTEGDAPAPLARPKEGAFRRLASRFWGYDYFVSYHWASGGAYAVALAQRLRDRGYEVFLDRAE